MPAAKLLAGIIYTACEGQGGVFLIRPCLNMTPCHTTGLQDRAIQMLLVSCKARLVQVLQGWQSACVQVVGQSGSK